MRIEYTSEEKCVSSVFFSYRNDIDIYTEDQSDDKAFYVILFQRLLSGTGINIKDVYPLGSSDDVINACIKDIGGLQKSIYIIDGDIYLLFSPKRKIPRLFVLDAYCMENMVIDETSVCNTISTFSGRHLPNEVQAIIKFDELLDNHLELVELFYYKAIERKYLGKIRLKHYSCFCPKGIFKKESVYNENTEIIKRIAEEIGYKRDDINSEIKDIRAKFPVNRHTLLNVVSGKDFLIPMISSHAKRMIGMRASYDYIAWKMNMAKSCSLERLLPLKDTIVSICHK